MHSSKGKRIVFLGIDNGPSGSVGIQSFNRLGLPCGQAFFKTPTYMMQDYTKAKKRISQLDILLLRKRFRIWKKRGYTVYAAMERPLVNPGRFNASAVGLRVHQSWLDLFTNYGFPHPRSLDSKEWQKLLLPKGTTGDELKKRSKEVANKLFPCTREVRHPDCDGMLISEWLRRQVMLK